MPPEELPAGCYDDQALAGFLDHRLGPTVGAAVEEHLAGCDRCAGRLSELPSVLLAPRPDETMPTMPGGPTPQRKTPKPELTPAAPLIPLPRGAQPPAALDRGATLGRYLILGHLGEGGMGIVYAAYDPDLERRVAIKVLRVQRDASITQEEGQARLLREAQAMARVSHQNVITVHDVGVLDDRVFVAMELVEGTTLRRWLKEKPRAPKEILEAFLKAGRGLGAAHAAGLVHRDFKPENVLIGDDGRVRVTDFGLARLASGDPGAASAAGAQDDSSGVVARGDVQLTRAGTVMGTPAYMSPEQFAGTPTDARSDQFSFCAALYWALFQKRPFNPRELQSVALELDAEAADQATRPGKARAQASRKSRPSGAVASVIAEPPRDTKVPAHVRKAILRGLALDREDRFESMDALLAELSRDPGAVRRRWLATATACVLVGSAVGVYQQVAQSRSQLCTGAERRLAGVWDRSVREAVRSAFARTGHPFAATASARAAELLDAYAGGWAAMHKDACEATRIRGEQTEELLGLRMTCLERRRSELDAVAKVLRAPDAKTVTGAIDAVQALPPLARCADVEALTHQSRLPDDPAKRAEIARVEAMLAEAKALLDAGQVRGGLAKAYAAADAARALGFKPTLAEALHLLGSFEQALNAHNAGEQTLVSAVFAGQASRHDEMVIRAAAKLVYVACCHAGDFEEAARWSELAKATLERIGGSDLLEGELLANLGSAYWAQGKREEAVSVYERALALTERALVADHSRRAIMLSNLGTLYAEQRAFDRAVEVLTEAIAIFHRTRGEEHVSVAFTHDSMAVALRGLGKLDQARGHAEKAMALFEASLGAAHPALATAMETASAIALDEGRLEAARTGYQRALELKERALGLQHPDLTAALDGLAKTLLRQRRPAQAVKHLERALALKISDPMRGASVRFGLAQALWASRGDRARAHALALEAKEAFVKASNGFEAAKVEAWLQGAGF